MTGKPARADARVVPGPVPKAHGNGAEPWEPIRALRPLGLALTPSPGAAGALVARYSLATGASLVRPPRPFRPTDLAAVLVVPPSPSPPCGFCAPAGW